MRKADLFVAVQVSDTTEAEKRLNAGYIKIIDAENNLNKIQILNNPVSL